MSNGKTIADAEKHIKEAKKALQVSPWKLKFKPEPEEASLEYQEAAKIFQSCGKYQPAIDAYKESAALKQSLNDYFGAGRNFDAAATIHENFTKDWRRCVDCLKNAVHCYREAMKFETAVRVLRKIAGIAEERLKDTEIAVSSYELCYQVYQSDVDDDHMYDCIDICKAYADYLIRNGYIKEVLSVLDRQLRYHRRLDQDNNVPKVVLSKVILRLSMDDPEGAEQEIAEAVELAYNLCATPECSVGKEAIDAYKQGDTVNFKKLMSSSCCTYLPVEIAKLARKIEPPSNGAKGGSLKEPVSAAEMLM